MKLNWNLNKLSLRRTSGHIRPEFECHDVEGFLGHIEFWPSEVYTSKRPDKWDAWIFTIDERGRATGTVAHKEEFKTLEDAIKWTNRKLRKLAKEMK